MSATAKPSNRAYVASTLHMFGNVGLLLLFADNYLALTLACIGWLVVFVGAFAWWVNR